MWQILSDFFKEGTLANMLLDSYFVFIMVYFVARFILKTKYVVTVVVPIALVYFLLYISKQLDLGMSTVLYDTISQWLPLGAVIILAPEIHDGLEKLWKRDSSVQGTVKGSDDNKMAIADAVMFLASRKIGALITIEKHQLLDQYSEKAIIMNAEISKELLINIFSPLTPLHDGAVIIKGNKIRCAGAYYVLSQKSNLDKTVGSRHRAALGIAEITDSLTIVVSEETGKISITYSGIMFNIQDKDKLLEYINLAMD